MLPEYGAALCDRPPPGPLGRVDPRSSSKATAKLEQAFVFESVAGRAFGACSPRLTVASAQPPALRAHRIEKAPVFGSAAVRDRRMMR
jgi:hypothetical protein